MTTIAWDGKTLASDSQAQTSDIICSTSEVKIYQPQSGERWSIYGETVLAIGCAGECGIERELQKLMSGNLTYESQFIPSTSFTAIAVISKSLAYIIGKSQGEDRAGISPQTEPYAIGSGDVIASTAMRCGKNAVEAVRIAIAMDPNSGGHIQAFTV